MNLRTSAIDRLARAMAAGMLVFAASCSSAVHSAPRGTGTAPRAASSASTRLPTGPQGALIALGRDIIEHTPTRMPRNIRAGMSCEACHIAAGTRAHGGSFVGTYATFPQWNKRARRYIALQDRLAECFLYSMNGRPPAYSSHEMVALVAYIAFLSRGTPVGSGASNVGLEHVVAAHRPDTAAGAHIYARTCAACHGASGQGLAGPALWGSRSFNGGAGMHRLATMAGFVRYNMPFGSPPDTLSKQDAIDVSAFVLAHPRPAFDRHARIAFPPLPASYF